MLRILQLEAIERALANSTDLAQSYAKRNPTFPLQLETWLLELERILQNTRLPAASTIAAVKSTLTSVREGALPPGITIIGRPTARKRLRLAAAEAMRQAIDVVQRAIEHDRTRFEEAERVAAQLISVARANGTMGSNGVPIGWPAESDGGKDVSLLISKLKNSKLTAQGMAELEGLTGPADAMIVLDRKLEYGMQ